MQSVPMNRWPAWLQRHIRACRLPERFKPDFTVKLPQLGTRALDPHAHYKFGARKSIRKYIAAFCRDNGLKA